MEKWEIELDREIEDIGVYGKPIFDESSYPYAEDEDETRSST